MLWGPIFILEVLKITAGKFIVCHGKVKHYLRRHIQLYIKIETDVGKDKENLSIIVILSHILALDMRQKLWDISYQQAWK